MPTDEQVLKAMARWPNVPAVHGWLRLDRRGRWLLVDRGAPGFDEAQHGAGSEITNPQIVAFIGRNYLRDEQGRWYWQNGPQRVFVDAAPAPLVFRVVGEAPRQVLTTHTGVAVSRIERAASDPAGNLWLATDLGPGLVDDRDLAALDLTAAGDDTEADVLTLMGRHRLERLALPPPEAFGFVDRPR
jgi:hypothetical protein